MDMGQNSFLAKVGFYKWIGIIVIIGLIIVGLVYFGSPHTSTKAPLRVAISPYQDIAMTANIKPLGLESKYNTNVDLITLPWENIMPSVVGGGADVGFASYIEYLTKMDNINAGSNDPLVFVYPLYVFNGGAFATFEDQAKVPTLDAGGLKNPVLVKKFLSGKIGAQKTSVYEMMIYSLAESNGVDPKSLHLVDTTLNQGFLAAESGSLDSAEVGLTQLSEAQSRGGRSVLSMDDLGFADLTGLVVRKSVLEQKGPEIQAFVKMWFDSVNYVYSDMGANSKYSLAYLDGNASTKYTLDSYKTALSQEYLPRSLIEAQQAMIDPNGKFSYTRIGQTVQNYLLANGIIKSKTPIPAPIDVQ